jgi:hypothetical protein
LAAYKSRWHHQSGEVVHLSHIESDPLALVVDFGAVGMGLAVALVLLAMLWSQGSPPRSAARFSAVALAFGLYALVSFAGPVLGLMLPAWGLLSARWLNRYQVGWTRPRWVALLAVLAVVSTLLLWLHPARPGRASDASTAEAAEMARRAPLSGRYLWRLAQSETLSESLRQGLLQRSAELAGNDYWLLEAVGRHHLAHQHWQEAFVYFDRALGLHPGLIVRLDAWVARLPDAAAATAVALQFPELTSPILTALDRQGRHAELLEAALAMPDSAAIVLARIRAAQGLGYPELARGFAERLQGPPSADSGECQAQASGLWITGFASEALAAMEGCIAHEPQRQDLISSYLLWALDGADSPQGASPEVVDAMLDQLNLGSASDPAMRGLYYHVLARHQARNGQCRAAALSRGLELDTGVAPLPFPAWVTATCVDLMP